MPAFNQNRGRVIRIVFAVIFLLIVFQLINLQVFSTKYKLAAENNAIFRKTIYPDRGIIYDRKKRSLLENTMSNDLVVIPSETKGADTAALCNLLGIDTAAYKKRMKELVFKNTSVKPSVFEAFLPRDIYARLNENMYRFPGFSLVEHATRSYPYNIAAQVLGYIGEVDTGFLRRHKDEGYDMGDYAGMNGLERTYEKVLMGQRGIKRFVRDNKSRIRGSYENGLFDTATIAGRNLFTSMDVQVQQMAEQLLQNKIGSAVAIDPRTGGIIAMVSSPGYNPNLLTGHLRRKNLGRLLMDTAKPMYNRAIKGQYPPGSTFKPLGALVALDEGVVNPEYGYACTGAYTACGIRVKCEHAEAGHAANLRAALASSCNAYFSQLFRMSIDNPAYRNTEEGYRKWKAYLNSFGLGTRLDIDLPSADSASIPSVNRYNKDFGGAGRWNACNILTLAIGQDRMTATPLQLANAMCIIANKGYYYTPHFVDSIEHEVVDDTVYLGKYRRQHIVTHIPGTVYQAVHDGMHAVTMYGTASAIKVPGVLYCAKTGTAQNPHGEDHSVFVCFAPKDNPTIAIAVVVENAGVGSKWAGPIAGFMMEQYLNNSIATSKRADFERICKADLRPPAIRNWYARMETGRGTTAMKDEIVQEEIMVQDNPGINFAAPSPPGGKGDPSNEKKKEGVVSKAWLPDTGEKRKKKDSHKL